MVKQWEMDVFQGAATPNLKGASPQRTQFLKGLPTIAHAV